MAPPTDNPVQDSQRGLKYGLAGILVLMILLAVVSLVQMHQQQLLLDRIVRVHMGRAELAATMSEVARERTLILYRLLFTDDLFEQDDEIERLRQLAGRFIVARNELLAMQLTTEERELLARQGRLSGIAVPLQRRIIDLISNGERSAARDLLINKSVAAQDAVLAVVDEFERLQHNAAAAAADEAARQQRHATWLIIGLSGLALLIGLGVSGWVVRLVHRHAAHHEHLATHDALTGLPNRLLLLDRLAQQIARSQRNDTLTGVFFIDLDNFKAVNDTLGHAAGDQLLVSAVARMTRCIRGSDTLARLSGDEFVLVMCDVTAAADLEAAAQKVVDCLAEPFDIGGQAVRVGASVGLAIYPYHGDDADSLLHHADLAMYGAKGDGRSRWHLYGRVVEQDRRVVNR